MAVSSNPRAAGPQWWGASAYRGLVLGTGVVAAVLFGGMALLVCADVFLRNTGLTSMPWTVEVTEYMLMVAAFLAAPWVLYTNDHIKVDVIVRILPQSVQRLLGFVGDVICLAICAVLAWETLAVLLDTKAQGGMVFKVLIFAEWWLALPMLLSFVMLTIEFARRIVRTFKLVGAA